ncbi:TFIID-18kDa-domain-containing protein [Dendrothele bispora CBS 962.96]|uniref:Transcription initiation factor TFIID subunit 13 n=1 Tax=Dendrothele bispora (strain CBS 962.96) TaxID=1314807 RepID=A0A4S8LKU4_DENBC|nr:TFIID-18kDa-domain-containing protein [Dendrothele bispora CBS 962.96]
MSYYTPAGTQPTTATYPYGAYTPYTYQHGAYQWPYAYTYGVPHQQTPARPATTTTTATPQTAQVATPATASTSTPAPLQRSTPSYTYTPSYTRDTGRSTRKQSNLKGLFTKELRNLMYGFGDDRNPANDTVNVMEEILIEYITDVCATAGGPSRKSRLSIEDIRRALSRPADAKKLARMEELLFMQEDIKRARAQFDETDLQSKTY